MTNQKITKSSSCQVPVTQLRRTIHPSSLPGPKDCAKHKTHIIGQERAVQALELGLRLDSPGYNVYVSGPSGSGRMTTVKHILLEFKQPRKPLCDYAYVHNFQEADRPRLLALQPGKGSTLKKNIENLLKTIKRELPKALATEPCQKERDRIVNEYRRKEHELINVFQEKVRRAKFMVVELQNGTLSEHDVLPAVNGEPQPFSTIEEKVAKGEMTDKQLHSLERKHHQLRSEMEQIRRRTRGMVKEMVSKLEELDRQNGSIVLDVLIEEILDQFEEESVHDYLAEVREALLERVPALVRREEEEEEEDGSKSLAPGGEMTQDILAPFKVNVILNTAPRKGCPVVKEFTPTMARLFGTIERSADDTGRPEMDFMNIRAGSLLRADGGFLVLKAEDLLSEPGAWKALKQTLSSGKLEIRNPEGPMGPATSALKPDPIPLSIKIIMLGDEDLYRSLYLMEEDFSKTFKVKAEFDVEMDYRKENVERFIAFIQRVVLEEDLLPHSRESLAALLEESMREVENQDKFTTCFRVVADFLRESTYRARQSGHTEVQPEDVKLALCERRKRFNLTEEKYREQIEKNVVMVATDGARIGQVNGLAVFDLGDYCFGKPCRISTSVGVGSSGIVNIEREVGLSGSIHDKGVYILSGFLRNRYGRNFPLSLDASVCFEQSYGPVDGDSASSTEMYALLSSLAEIPLAQSIAVTGSINQNGEIQAISGVNHKIEGFFETCIGRGLTGGQGVIIPRSNIQHLMLDEEVIAAVKKKKFFIWAVSSIDEGMEILTGIPAGQTNGAGEYPVGTINRKVADRLKAMADVMKQYR